MEFTRIGVYHRECNREGTTEHHYEFRLKGQVLLPQTYESEEEDIPESFTRVRVIRLPKHLTKEIAGLESQGHSFLDDGNELGWIRYRLKGTTAISRSAYPENRYLLGDAKRRVLSGLGALLEHACATHLKTRGITHCSTTHAPSGQREGQRIKLDLPRNTPVPIDDWLVGLEKGFPKPPENRLARIVNTVKGKLRRRRR